jgi:hypothetical protein
MFRIDQTGLATGVVDRSRTDGLLNGAQVTLTYFGTGTFRARFLWVPPGDTGSIATLAEATAGVWTFTPSAGFPGTYRIEGIENEGQPNELRRVRVFRVRTASGLIIPAPNETANHLANLANATATHIAQSEDNAVDYPTPALNDAPWTGWWRVFAELVGIAEVAFDPAPRWRTIANINFKAVGNTTFSSDGAYTIDGQPFSFANRANLYNLAENWAVLDSTGLRARSNATGTTLLAGTAPRLTWRGTALRGDAPTRARLVYDSSGGSAVDTRFALEWDSSATYRFVANGYTAGGYGFESYTVTRACGGAQATLASNISLGVPGSVGLQNVIGHNMPIGAHPIRGLIVQFANESDGGAALGLNYVKHEVLYSYGSGNYTTTMGVDNSASALGIMICPEFGTQATGVGIIYSRFIVEQFY